jgi:hypothetical protein
MSILAMSVVSLANRSGAEDAAPAAQAQDTLATASNSKNANQVLRHAVFFKFKATSSTEDVRQIVDAFRALPTKMNQIAEMEWGPNIGPEQYSDGFTHCFLLSFKDAESRATYLPHPDHKAFGSVLRPHLEKVFVLDFWGAPQSDRRGDELKHLVLFKFSPNANSNDIETVERSFAELPAKISTIKAFEWGKNDSPESFDDGFTHCFMLSFNSEAELADYAAHPDHTAFAKRLKPAVEKIRVFDFWAKEKDRLTNRGS